jgi:hypothetical protein
MCGVGDGEGTDLDPFLLPYESALGCCHVLTVLVGRCNKTKVQTQGAAL